MKKVITGIFLLMVSPLALAAGGSHYLFKAPSIDETDKAAIQRGARVFVNYCLTCHSAEYMRYKRVSDDLGINEKLMKENLMFASDKIHEGMQVAIEPDDAKRWFGVQPPDLSVTARSRGSEWLYNYFMTFYRDDSRDIGVNNVTFPGAAMPHVLWELQGWQEPVYETVKDHDGKDVQKIVDLKLVEAGTLSHSAYPPRRASEDC